MQHSGITWTHDELLAYLQAPSRVVPGNRMPYAGLHNPQQAAALVAYLATLH
jgi:cytochrome c